MDSELKLPQIIKEKVFEGYIPYSIKLLRSSTELIESDDISKIIVARIQQRIKLINALLSSQNLIIQNGDQEFIVLLSTLKSTLDAKLDIILTSSNHDFPVGDNYSFYDAHGDVPIDVTQYIGKEFLIKGVKVKIIGYTKDKICYVRLVVNEVAISMGYRLFLGFKFFLDGTNDEGIYLNADQKTYLKRLLDKHNLNDFYLKLVELMVRKGRGERVN